MNGIYAIKPLFKRALKPLDLALVRAKIHPDLLTFSALALSVAGGLVIAQSSQAGCLWLLCTTPATASFRTVLNALDGMVAVDSGLARPWGEVLNEFSDRLSDLAIFGGLALSGLFRLPLLTAAVVLILLSSYLGILSKAAGGPRQYGGVMGKADRMILLGIFGPLAFFVDRSGLCPASFIADSFSCIVIAGSLATLFQRGLKTYVDLKSAGK